jgi:hypothetical protein
MLPLLDLVVEQGRNSNDQTKQFYNKVQYKEIIQQTSKPLAANMNRPALVD